MKNMNLVRNLTSKQNNDIFYGTYKRLNYQLINK